MNIKGRDVLLGAFMEGVKQLRDKPIDQSGGFCAIALLLYATGCQHLSLREEVLMLDKHTKAHLICQQRVRSEYDITDAEWWDIKKENDEMGWDFLSIAWMHTRHAL